MKLQPQPQLLKATIMKKLKTKHFFIWFRLDHYQTYKTIMKNQEYEAVKDKTYYGNVDAGHQESADCLMDSWTRFVSSKKQSSNGIQ